MYEDNIIRNAGVTASSPGTNEQIRELESNNFIYLNSENNDLIFYYFPINPANQNKFFRCGYFSRSERKMTDVMKSQINYFDIEISSNGTFFAALSHNGNKIKISVISLEDKKLIYSDAVSYDAVLDFSFSPDEKRFIIYGTENRERTLRVINIDWTEE